MDLRLSQLVYSSFRVSRGVSYSAGAQLCANNLTKHCFGSLTPCRFASPSILWHSEGSVQKVDRQSFWQTEILSSHRSSGTKKQRNIWPKTSTRLSSSLIVAPIGCTSVKNDVLYTQEDVRARQSPLCLKLHEGSTRFASSSASAAGSGKATGYEGIKNPSDITQSKYNQLADDYLEAVQQWLEDLSDADESVEVEFSAGVLTVTLPPAGTYVINKQPPNKQIWLSSPISGPKRYDFVSLGKNGDNGDWVYLRDGSTMTNLLREEMGIILPEKENL